MGGIHARGGQYLYVYDTKTINPYEEKTVGSDCFPYKPLTLEMINEIMQKHFPQYL